MNLKTVIFDLDGTLVHTTPEYRYLVVGKVLAEFNKSTENQVIDDFWFLSEEDRRRIIGDIWELDFKEQFWPTYRKYDTIESRREYIRLYEDVGILRELKQRDIKTGIVTAAPSHMIDFEVGMLNHKFDAIVRAQLTSGIQPKPSSQGIEKCLQILSSKKEGTGYVGDSRTDMETAENAGIRAILIARGEYDFGVINCSLKISSLYKLRKFA